MDTPAPATTATDAPAASKTVAVADDTAPGEDAVPHAGIPGDSVPAAGRDTAPVQADGGPRPALAGEAAELLRREVAATATQLAELLGRGDTATALAP